MIDEDIAWLSASEVTVGIRAGHFSVADVAEVMIERIQG